MHLIKSIFFSAFSLMAFNAHAIDQMYNWNGLEFVTSGNVTHVHPASPQSTVLRGGWTLDISDVEPKATATHPVPYKNKSNAIVTVKPQIDPNKVSSRVAQGLKNAAAGAATTGNGYVALGALACGLFDCGSAVLALADWGVDQLKKNDDGSLSVEVPDSSVPHSLSDGYYYKGAYTTLHLSYSGACSEYAVVSWEPRATDKNITSCTPTSVTVTYKAPGGSIQTRTTSIQRMGVSPCLSGSYVINNQCVSDIPKIERQLETYLQSNYTGKGWNHHWAKMTAALAAQKINVFSDSMSTAIEGPALVPLSSNEQKTGVQLLPGTTTPAPSGHTGPTESGTQTTTTTTTAHNKFNPAPLTPGSSGSPASGPSMETTQKTTTTTTITNNVTNITNIVNETTTEKDEAPEEAPTDTPFADLPELYKQKYSDGLIGVLRTQTAAMKATPLFQLPTQLMGDLPQTGQCPSWQLDLSLASWASFGTYNVGADCAIWDFAGWVIVISAFILARQLIFGG